MRAVRVPVFVLAAVLAYILCNAAWVTGESQRWLDAAAHGRGGFAREALEAVLFEESPAALLCARMMESPSRTRR